MVSFLYCFQITLYAGLGTLMGQLVDGSGDIQGTLWWTCGVQFTIISVMSLLSTLVPKGAFALNPKVIGVALDMQQEQKERGDVEQGEVEVEKGAPEDVEETWRRSMGSPILLQIDTIPRAMPTSK